MSLFEGIGDEFDDMCDEVIDVEHSVGGAYTSFLTGLECTFEPIGGGSKWLAFALSSGATHVAHLQTHQPTIARGMRVVKGGAHYPVILPEHNDGQFTDVLVQMTKATG